MLVNPTQVEKIASKTTKLKNDRFLEFPRRSMVGAEYNCIITSELANQSAPKALFTCVLYTYIYYICIFRFCDLNNHFYFYIVFLFML